MFQSLPKIHSMCDCPICLTDGKQHIFITESQQIVCSDCMQSHIDTWICSSYRFLKCPVDNEVKLDYSRYKFLIGESNKKKYMNKLQSLRFYDRMQTIFEIKNSICLWPLIMLTISSWCSIPLNTPCLIGFFCWLYQLVEYLQDIYFFGVPEVVLWTLTKLTGGNIKKKCPLCHAYIEKKGGCNHITCLCGHEFCWCCQRSWRQDKIYNINNLGDVILKTFYVCPVYGEYCWLQVFNILFDAAKTVFFYDFLLTANQYLSEDV